MQFLKKVFSKQTFFVFALVFALGIFLGTGQKARANFMQQVGIQAGGTGTANPTQNNTWLQFSQAVNANDTNITSWSGFPLLAMSNHIIALIYGYPDQNGKVIPGNGALSMADRLMATMYTQEPSSANLYLASVINNIGFNQPSYAAAPTGPGTALFPTEILNWWGKIRDIAYIFMVVVLVTIGFMIMFRFKLNPQTSVTVQDSLPKIAVSLILITLSYALVGLMIDLAYLGNELIRYIVNQQFGQASNLITDTLFFIDPKGHGGTFGNVNIFDKVGGAILQIAIGKFDNFIQLIIAITLLATSVKILFALLTKYVTLLLGAIFAPIVVLWGTLPGQGDSFPKFLKGLAAAALAFPMVILFLSLASAFATLDANNVGKIPLDPLEPLSSPGIVQGGLNSLVALGILMATAQIPQIIDDALEVKPSAVSGVAEAGGLVRRIPIIGSFLG